MSIQRDHEHMGEILEATESVAFQFLEIRLPRRLSEKQ